MLQFNPLILDHHQLHFEHVKILVLDIFIVIEISLPIVHHLVQDTLSSITNEESLHLFTFLPSELTAIFLFVDKILEIYKTLKSIILLIVPYHDHVPDLRLCLEDL